MLQHLDDYIGGYVLHYMEVRLVHIIRSYLDYMVDYLDCRDVDRYD